MNGDAAVVVAVVVAGMLLLRLRRRPILRWHLSPSNDDADVDFVDGDVVAAAEDAGNY